MEKQIKDAFAELKMSQTCAWRIQSSLRQHRRTPGWIRYAAVATACLLLLVLILANPTLLALDSPRLSSRHQTPDQTYWKSSHLVRRNKNADLFQTPL